MPGRNTIPPALLVETDGEYEKLDDNDWDSITEHLGDNLIAINLRRATALVWREAAVRGADPNPLITALAVTAQAIQSDQLIHGAVIVTGLPEEGGGFEPLDDEFGTALLRTLDEGVSGL